jgi:hypothetical protein
MKARLFRSVILLIGAVWLSYAADADAPERGGTTTFTLDCWDDAFDSGNGNNCDFCSGTIQPNHRFTYNCNEGTQYPWTPSCNFVDPTPAGTVVTSVRAVVVMIDCSGQRSYPSSTYNVLLNGHVFAPARTSSLNNCGCGSGPGCLREDFASQVFAQGIAFYVKDTQNTMTIAVPTGSICVEQMIVTLAYAPAATIPAFGRIGLIVLGLFVAAAGLMLLRLR